MNRQWILVSRPEGLPKISDFGWREESDPVPLDGEVLIRTIYLSLDPAIRGWMGRDTYVPAIPLRTVMRGVGIGVVEMSNNPSFQPGDRVQGMLGWQTFCISDGSGLVKLPHLPVPLKEYFALLGHIGLTAYFGLIDIGHPKPGETLVVSAAAGAVGSLAGQIGKIFGCRVVGLAGTDEKCDWITHELGFDAAINYRTEDLNVSLRAHCPRGVDIYFDNVGGYVLETMLEHMNDYGRIVACGMISTYNQAGPEGGPSNLSQIVSKRLRIQGFIVTDFMARAKDAARDLMGWHMAGSLKYRVDLTLGLGNAPKAFLKLFDGTNQGKVIVQVGVEP